MRIKNFYISNYKNLIDFSIDFYDDSFLEVFVGKNGSGKSNFIEALLETLRHIYQYDWGESRHEVLYSYRLTYEIDAEEQCIEFDFTQDKLTINGDIRATVGNTPLPDHILIYYAGHNSSVNDLLTVFDKKFSGRLIKADQEDTRPFIRVNHTYNDLLLTIFALLPSTSDSRKYVIDKLAIKTINDLIKIKLTRPHYAKTKRFDVLSSDANDPSKFWQLAGTARTLLDTLCLHCFADKEPNGRVRTEGYLYESDTYQLYFSIEKIKNYFTGYSAYDFLRIFDNLKALGMLDLITLEFSLLGGSNIASNVFSDGQFQAIYLYSISEIFKETNSITIMDEPDSFLHPEWQAQCAEQIQAISTEASASNHIIMTSHSAVTLINSPQRKIRYFEENNGRVRTYTLPKRESVRRLCQGVITYTEEEQMLSVLNAINIDNKPILFTEGSSDPLIIKSAWYKLFPDIDMPFIVFYAFSCTYINQLITDHRIHREMNGRKIFALYDFDKAYNQWNSLNGDIVRANVSDGLVKKWRDGEAYAIMLPIPDNYEIQKQVFKDEYLTTHFEGASYCMIEHEFYGLEQTNGYFINDATPGGHLIKFQGDKMTFASEVVPSLPAIAFEPFRNMLKWVSEQC